MFGSLRFLLFSFIMLFMLAGAAHAYFETGEIYTERFAYEGTIAKYEDSDLSTQIGDPFTVDSQDVAIYSDNNYDIRSVITGAYWYDPEYDEDTGNWDDVIDPGFMQYWDSGQQHVVEQSYSFDGFDGQHWTEFNFSTGIENAPYDYAYSVLYPDENGYKTGEFHTLNLEMTVTGLQGVSSTWEDGWIYASEADKSPDSVTGSISGVFEDNEQNFYSLDFNLNMDSWAFENADDFYEGYYHARPVPEPGTLILLGTGVLLLMAFGRQKLLKKVDF